MHLGERIKLLREERGWQQKELALKLNCPQSTVSMWETEKQEPNPSMRRKLCGIFGITEAELFNTSSIKETGAAKSAPLLTWDQINQLAPLNAIPKNISDNHIYTSMEAKNIFALEIIEDSMHPEFREEDTIVIDGDAEINPNEYIIAFDNVSARPFLTQLKKYGDKTFFHPLNPKYPDIEMNDKNQYTIIGKVVEKIKKY